MRRVIELTWGIVLLLVATAVLAWIAYSLAFASAPSKHPWWWAVLLVALWTYVFMVGLRRVRGRSHSRVRT